MLTKILSLCFGSSRNRQQNQLNPKVKLQLCCVNSGWDLGPIPYVVSTFDRLDWPINLFSVTTRDVWIIPAFQIWVCMLHVEYISCVIANRGQYQWVVPSLFSEVLWPCWGRGDIAREYTIPIFGVFFQNFVFPGCFPYIWSYSYHLPLLSSIWVVIAVCGSISVQGLIKFSTYM